MRAIASCSQPLPGRAPQPRCYGSATMQRKGELRRAPAEGYTPERMLLTLLFTDIVGSTSLAERAGDAIWSALLARHHAIVRRLLVCYGGTEVDVAGDGFFCIFTSPTRAVRCAQAIRAAVNAIGLEIRAGVHAGECERHRSRICGIAVHVGARIAAVAGPGQIRVSAVVRDLVAGSGLLFADEAAYSLRGLSKPCLLYRVADAAIDQSAPSQPRTAAAAEVTAETALQEAQRIRPSIADRSADGVASARSPALVSVAPCT